MGSEGGGGRGWCVKGVREEEGGGGVGGSEEWDRRGWGVRVGCGRVKDKGESGEEGGDER